MTEQTLYPGSRHPRRAVAAAPAPAEAPSWDARPVKKRIKGVDRELFPVGALAAAVGRSAVTMRLWERNGVLPAAKFRLQNKNNVGGRRYYTRGQIEAIVRIAGDLGMLGEQRRIHPDFTANVVQAWRDLERGERASA